MNIYVHSWISRSLQPALKSLESFDMDFKIVVHLSTFLGFQGNCTLNAFDMDFKVVEVTMVQASPSTAIVISCIEACQPNILSSSSSSPTPTWSLMSSYLCCFPEHPSDVQRLTFIRLLIFN